MKDFLVFSNISFTPSDTLNIADSARVAIHQFSEQLVTNPSATIVASNSD